MKCACIMPRNVAESSRIQEKSPHSKCILSPHRNRDNKLTLQKCPISVLSVTEIRQAAKQEVDFMLYCFKKDSHFPCDICHFLREVSDIHSF